MGTFIFFDVHRADLYFRERNVFLLQQQEHIGFVLKPVARNIQHSGQKRTGNGPQTGLRIGNGQAYEKFEDTAGEFVAETAAEWYIRLVKIPDAQGEFAPFCHGFCTGKNVCRLVLTVTVHGNYAHAIGPVFQKITEGGLQGRALAPVHMVVQQSDLRMGFSRVDEMMEIFRLAAIIDQQNIPKTHFQKSGDDNMQFFIRVQRGQDHGDVSHLGHGDLLCLVRKQTLRLQTFAASH